MLSTEAPVRLFGSHRNVGPIQLLREAVNEVVSRRRLIRYLVSADIRKRGADTFLGNLWWILDPILQMGVYLVLVTVIRSRETPDYALFIFAALLPWKWFQAVINDATTSVVRQERLIRQIAFPKIILPISAASAGVVGFAWGLIPLGAIILLHADRLSPLLLLFPVIAVVQYVFSVASAILISAANVFFRDLGNIVGHALRLWWFLSPGLYSLSQLQETGFVRENPWVGTLAGLNPFAVLFEAYRAVVYGTPEGPPFLPSFVPLLILLAGSLVLLVVSTILFKRLEPDFAKVL